MAWRWKNCLTVDAVGRADDRARPALEMADHPVADRLEIAREIELGDGLAVAGVRPQRLVGLGDDDAHHLGGLFGRRLRASRWLPRFDRGLRAAGFAILVMAGFSASTSSAGLSCRSPLNAACRILPSSVQPGEFDLGDQFGLQPMHVAGLARRVLAAERAVVGRRRLQRRHDALAPCPGRSRCRPCRQRRDDRRDRRRPSASGICRWWSSSRRSRPPARRGIWPWSSSRCGRSDRAHRASWRRCPRATACRPIPARHRRRSRNARHSGSTVPLPCARLQQFLQPRLALARAAGGADPRPRRTADRRQRRSARRSCRRRAPPAAPRNPARRHGRARRSRRRSARRAARCASFAIAPNLSVQSRPLRVFSVASPSSTRNCTR